MTTRTEAAEASEEHGSGSRRISVSLTGRAADTVRNLGDELELSEGDVVRRAISLLATITEETGKGSALLLKSPSGDTERIRFMPSL